MVKVWDVVPATDAWGRRYAHFEYLRIGLFRPLRKTIEVRDYVQGEEISDELVETADSWLHERAESIRDGLREDGVPV